MYYINGELVPADRATIPVDDLAVVRGYGVFEFLRTYGKKPFCLEEHLKRLEHSALLTVLPFPWSLDELAGVVTRTLNRNRHRESNIRVVVTGGPSMQQESPDGPGPDFTTSRGNPRLMVLVTPLLPMPRWWYTEGVKIITTTTERYIPGAKTLNYLPAIVEVGKAKKKESIEVFIISREGKVREGMTSNCFAFFGNKLVTPATAILPGVTRRIVLNLVRDVFDTETRDITIGELLKADEIFITATNKEVVPVVRVDSTIIGCGRPGTRTRRVMELFRKHTLAYAVRT